MENSSRYKRNSRTSCKGVGGRPKQTTKHAAERVNDAEPTKEKDKRQL